MNRKYTFVLILLLAAPVLCFAGNEENMVLNYVVYSLLGIALLLLIFSFVILQTFISTLKKDGINLTSGFTIDEIKNKLTDAVPLEREHEVLTDHLYDDIRELDNNLPRWWVYMFYMTIVFAVIYIGYFHFYDGALQATEYKNEMIEGEKKKQQYLLAAAEMVDENSVELLKSEDKILKGKSIFDQNCSACHGKAGEGGVGPNLTDEYWIHGGGIKNIFKSIKYGIPQKGMISWKSQMSPSMMQEVASYIVSLEGSNPANSKEPQGEIYKPE